MMISAQLIFDNVLVAYAIFFAVLVLVGYVIHRIWPENAAAILGLLIFTGVFPVSYTWSAKALADALTTTYRSPNYSLYMDDPDTSHCPEIEYDFSLVTIENAESEEELLAAYRRKQDESASWERHFDCTGAAYDAQREMRALDPYEDMPVSIRTWARQANPYLDGSK